MARPGKGSATFSGLDGLEAAARRRLSGAVWGYVAGGAGEERTLAENEAAFSRWVLRPRVGAGVREVDLSTTLLGTTVRAPFFVAPTAYHGEIHPGGERATAASTGALGLLGVYSTLSSDSLETIALASGRHPRWFQLYFQRRWKDSLALVRRAEAAGYGAVVVTLDAPVLGSRDRQARSGFAIRSSPPVGNGPGAASPPRGPEWHGGPYAPRGGDVSWQAVRRIVAATQLPVVAKGILTAEDARRAVESGVRAVYVSNHGGRQLDRAPASLDALPEVVRAVGSSAEGYLDGGVRRGSDALVALGLGARAVGLGRPVLWALAAGGQDGVGRFLRLFGSELANALLLLGRGSPHEVDGTNIAPVGSARGRPPHGPGRPSPPRSVRAR